MTSPKPRLLFLITEDWYFWTHRLDLARAAQKVGYDVSIATRVQNHGSRILAEGLRLLPISLVRRSRNPLRELSAISELTRLYERERPTIVHHVAMKPILYGTIAAQLARIPVIVNAFAGLGYAFVEGRQDGLLTRTLLHALLRRVLGSTRGTTIFQNNEDRETLLRSRIVRSERTRIIRGAGVNLEMFSPKPPAGGVPVVLLAARMLWDKGIREFVDAARTSKERGVLARFVLVGASDPENPAHIPTSQLKEWAQAGWIEWWGPREDMPSVISQAELVVLPSYREGLPKILLEAAAAGRALVATDVPGCREIVRHMVNGLLVPPRDAETLARAISQLIENPGLRESMGKQGREIVEAEFSSTLVANQTLTLYRDLLGKEGPR